LEEAEDKLKAPYSQTADTGFYRSIFENVHDGIYRSSPEGRIINANPALVSMLGYDSEEELKQLNISTDIYYSSAERDRYINAISESGWLKDTELTLRRKDGSKITVLENSRAVYDDSGNLVCYEGTLTEITGLKITEEALRESQEKYRTLIDTLQDGLSVFDFQGNITFCNSKKRIMLGYESDEEIKKENIYKIIHPADLEKAQRILNGALKTGIFPMMELRVVRKDGTSFWAEFGATFLRDSKGDPAYIMDTMRDITGRKEAEEQLMILKQSVDGHYDGAYWIDVNNRITYVNNSACRDTGFSREELIGKELSYINPLATKEVLKLIWEKLRKDGSFTAEAVMRRKNGTLFPVEIVSSYINFGGKEYSCGFARDITDRKISAEEMKIRFSQLRQIIDTVPSYIFAKDIDGRFLLANKALADVFGLASEEIQGKSDSDYGATPEQVRWYRKHDLEVINKGHPVNIPEEQVLRKDGTLGWFQTVKIPYRHPGVDKPAILGVSTEITERKKAEDELRQSEARFRNLFEQHSAVKILIDPEDGRILDANKAASEYFGWSVAKLKKMRVTEISGMNEEGVLLNIRKAIGNTSAVFETSSRLANGSIRDIEVFASRITNDDKDYLHSIIHDITDKKKMVNDLIAAKDRAEESDKIKTAFLHNISHEIRTPMNAIVGFASLMNTSGLSEESRIQYADIIFQSSHQLLSIITDIVDISNIDAGVVKVSEDNLVVDDLMRQILDQHVLRAEKLKLALKLKIPAGNTKLRIITDSTKLQQIISNLIDNAIKFTREGTIEFGYKLKKDLVEFFVSDTGKGIEREELGKIFDRFYQINDFTENKPEGTGLGLAICKEYAGLLGGEISASSQVGKGSKFTFHIPLKKQNRPSGKR